MFVIDGSWCNKSGSTRNGVKIIECLSCNSIVGFLTRTAWSDNNECFRFGDEANQDASLPVTIRIGKSGLANTQWLWNLRANYHGIWLKQGQSRFILARRSQTSMEISCRTNFVPTHIRSRKCGCFWKINPIVNPTLNKVLLVQQTWAVSSFLTTSSSAIDCFTFVDYLLILMLCPSGLLLVVEMTNLDITILMEWTLKRCMSVSASFSSSMHSSLWSCPRTLAAALGGLLAVIAQFLFEPRYAQSQGCNNDDRLGGVGQTVGMMVMVGVISHTGVFEWFAVGLTEAVVKYGRLSSSYAQSRHFFPASWQHLRPCCYHACNNSNRQGVGH